jgi:SAM-dependent methyltransferase
MAEFYKDIIEWDIYNWSRAFNFWNENVNVNNQGFQCLELGARGGGLSLWLADQENKVICSDIINLVETAAILHRKHGGTKTISYEIIDATNIPYENHFDIVILKSVLGGIGNNDKVAIAINQIYKALKPGGHFIFAENLKASGFHMIMRRLFSGCGTIWNYLDYNFLIETLKIFNDVKLKKLGMFGVFGRNEFQKEMLGKMDKYFFEKIFPEKWFYIMAGVARK